MVKQKGLPCEIVQVNTNKRGLVRGLSGLTGKQAALVYSGLFRFLHNPIFLGMRIILHGFFLAAPNVLTLLTLALGFVLIQIQARLEEEFLNKTYGTEYENFRRKVRSWL